MAAAFEPDLLQSVVTGEITQDEWEAEIVRVLAGRYPPADTATAVKQALGDVGYLDPAALAVVDAIRPQVTVCVVSNASTRLHADLELLGLREHVDCVLSSADFGIAKPDPRIFCRFCVVLYEIIASIPSRMRASPNSMSSFSSVVSSSSW
jgi:FMN phosphatase YigB (HAD superfamily)